MAVVVDVLSYKVITTLSLTQEVFMTPVILDISVVWSVLVSPLIPQIENAASISNVLRELMM